MSSDPTISYDDLTAAEAARVDAACDDFEQAWKAVLTGGAPPHISGYLTATGDRERAVQVHELIAVDRACRERYGIVECPDDYARLGVTLKAQVSSQGPIGLPDATTRGRAEGWPQLPGLELVELIGSGGMGVVFRARQAALDREVAVKLLRDAPLGGSGHRERFLQEARAVARLQHPHLVQVYEFAEAPAASGAGSQPYLVLEYVSGGNLAEHLRGGQLPPRDAARLIQTLADATDSAHQQGVIHRDLKPANILVQKSAQNSPSSNGPMPGSGTTSASTGATASGSGIFAKITDFGLAKLLTGSDLTHTGDVLGTPSYMAPEQTTGKLGAVTAAVDVYGLGAILYETLTGRPPFRAETAVATVIQVQHEDPVPPRRLQPTVPRDLETICLVCLQKDPRRRYATARELADDLRRFQAGEPIKARPVGPAERMLSWCRRKPVIAALLAALVLVLVGGMSGVLWQWRRAEHQATLADQNAAFFKRERDTAIAEHARAERHLKRVREKMDWLTTLGRDLWQKPQQYKTGKLLLEQALAFYQDILPEEGTNPRVRFEAAKLYRQVAEIQHFLGQREKAVASYLRQADLLQSLLAIDPANVEYRSQLASCHRLRGFVLRDMQKLPEARAAYDQAARIYEQLLAETPGDATTSVELANTLLNTAVLLSPPRDSAEIESLYQRMMALYRGAVAAYPAREWYQRELALGLEGLGMFYLDTGRGEAALEPIRETLAIREQVIQHGRGDPAFVRYVARAHVNLGRVLANLGRPGAEDAYREAVKLLDQAVQEYPDTPYFRAPLATIVGGLANLIKAPDRQAEVETLRRRAVSLSEQLVNDFPENLEHRRQLAESDVRLAAFLEDSARRLEAADYYRKAVAVSPESAEANNGLAWFLATAADPAARDGARAVQLAQKAVAAKPRVALFWNTLGVAQHAAGDDASAITSLETATRLRGSGNSFDLFFLAMAHARLGHAERAQQCFDQAVAWMDAHMPQHDELKRFRAEAEATLP